LTDGKIQDLELIKGKLVDEDTKHFHHFFMSRQPDMDADILPAIATELTILGRKDHPQQIQFHGITFTIRSSTMQRYLTAKVLIKLGTVQKLIGQSDFQILVVEISVVSVLLILHKTPALPTQYQNFSVSQI
jgi:hypothetical protein